MQVTIELPEDIGQQLISEWRDLPRAALEALLLEAYRTEEAQRRTTVPAAGFRKPARFGWIPEATRSMAGILPPGFRARGRSQRPTVAAAPRGDGARSK